MTEFVGLEENGNGSRNSNGNGKRQKQIPFGDDKQEKQRQQQQRIPFGDDKLESNGRSDERRAREEAARRLPLLLVIPAS
jgi:hypothetical protein